MWQSWNICQWISQIEISCRHAEKNIWTVGMACDRSVRNIASVLCTTLRPFCAQHCDRSVRNIASVLCTKLWPFCAQHCVRSVHNTVSVLCTAVLPFCAQHCVRSVHSSATLSFQKIQTLIYTKTATEYLYCRWEENCVSYYHDNRAVMHTKV